MSLFSETIVTLSTPMGPRGGAIAILRITGKDTISIGSQCLSAWQDWSANPRKTFLCSFKDPRSDLVLDDPMIIFFKNPASYTGEDLLEVHLHGGRYIIEKALEIFYYLGCRAADPGEFTRLAVLNGKMDLSQAEGIHGVISAQTQASWTAARQLASGKFSHLIEELRQQLIQSMAWLAAPIDFPDEEETSQIHLHEILSRVQKVQKTLVRLQDSYHTGKIAKEGLGVVFLGKPNAGKSTLLNSLLGQNRAIVTDIPGTTRDYIEESCLIRGRKFRFIDTAGLRASEDVVEKIGIDQSLALAQTAEVVCWLSQDQKLPESGNDSFKIDLNLLTKSDLQKTDVTDSLEEWIPLSTKTPDGLDLLKNKLCQVYDQNIGHSFGKSDDALVVCLPRHKIAIDEALDSLNRFLELSSYHASEELLAFELQSGATALASIIGEIKTDDLLDVIFSTFCLGK